MNYISNLVGSAALTMTLSSFGTIVLLPHTQSVLDVVFEPRKTNQDVLDCVKNFINDIDCYIRRL